MKYGVLFLLFLVAGCTNLTLRDEAPHYSWVAKRGLDRSTACVAGALDDAFRQSSPIDRPIVHRVSTIEKGQIYVVRPELDRVWGQLYKVRLMMLTDRETVIDLYALPAWMNPVKAALRRCL
ncbi:hypothetical protein FHS85_005192 [Rhodoligotrophos appendicifer]|uniref:hypothetical protein n=1 Tax=Rhodoligotrophos appendicifer TaxID=987056 RepID=UPI001185EF02|nr:hypothetical protein [Rhodoligotrophos appendicifer]